MGPPAKMGLCACALRKILLGVCLKYTSVTFALSQLLVAQAFVLCCVCVVLAAQAWMDMYSFMLHLSSDRPWA